MVNILSILSLRKLYPIVMQNWFKVFWKMLANAMEDFPIENSSRDTHLVFHYKMFQYHAGRICVKTFKPQLIVISGMSVSQPLGVFLHPVLTILSINVII